MKTKTLLSVILFAISFSGFSTKWTVTNTGFTFTPATLTITAGDSVFFNLAAFHNAIEVSQSIWVADSNAPLEAGFATPFGGGWVLPALLTVGTHYYVCETHASMGMKGKIIVNTATGIAANQPMVLINAYPNPVHEMLQLNAPAETLGTPFTLCDIQGKPLLTGIINQETFSIDFGPYANGMYLLQWGDQRKKTLKLLKN